MKNTPNSSQSNTPVKTVQVLISTMNQIDPRKLASKMGISEYVIINQITQDIKIPKDISTDKSIIVSLKEKGLSRSRNKAILYSSADICAIADDDMKYVDKYEKILIDGYMKYPDADIIAFYVVSEDPRQCKAKLKEGRLSLLKTMKIASVNITFRRQSIVHSNIKFDETFGTGTANYMGEENIFLFDCYRKGLKIYYIPISIAELVYSHSTWFSGINKIYFIVKGRVFYRMSQLLWPLLIIQFAIRKRKLYSGSLRLIQVLKYMYQGAKKQSKEERRRCYPETAK